MQYENIVYEKASSYALPVVKQHKPQCYYRLTFPIFPYNPDQSTDLYNQFMQQ